MPLREHLSQKGRKKSCNSNLLISERPLFFQQCLGAGMSQWAHWGGETGRGIPQLLWNEYLEGGWLATPASSLMRGSVLLAGKVKALPALHWHCVSHNSSLQVVHETRKTNMKPFWWGKNCKNILPTPLNHSVMCCWGCQEYWEQEERKHTSPLCAIFLLSHHRQAELGSQQPLQGSGLPRQGNLERDGVWWKPEGAPSSADGVRAAISLCAPGIHEAGGFLGDQETLAGHSVF